MNTETEKITDAELLELLQPFCSPDPARGKIATPFSENGHTCATDGRVYIRLANAIAGVREQYLGVVGSSANSKLASDPTLWRTVDFELPKHEPREEGNLKPCQECNGEGLIECCECGHERDCSKCDGRGEFGFPGYDPRNDSTEPFRLPTVERPYYVGRFYINLIAGLPGFAYEGDPQPLMPLLFRFRYGCGLLMPIRA